MIGEFVVGANSKPLRGLADLIDRLEQAGVGPTIASEFTCGSYALGVSIEADIGWTQ